MSLESVGDSLVDAQAGPRFVLDERSTEPIYLQLASQLTRQVAGGSLAPGDEVPSVRSLADDLGVSKMTVSKAYQLLESQGRLIRRRGRPLVVADAKGLTDVQALELLRPTLDRAAQEAFELGLAPEEVVEMFCALLQRKDRLPTRR